jgi:hypothetical protein
LAGLGLAVNGDGAKTCKVTVIILSGPGVFVSFTEKLVVPFAARLAQAVLPAIATGVNLSAVLVAVAVPLAGVTVSQSGRAGDELTVNGVPPVAVDVNARDCATPAV